jgi:hypothetical protein
MEWHISLLVEWVSFLILSEACVTMVPQHIVLATPLHPQKMSAQLWTVPCTQQLLLVRTLMMLGLAGTALSSTVRRSFQVSVLRDCQQQCCWFTVLLYVVNEIVLWTGGFLWEIWGAHSSAAEQYNLLWCDTVKKAVPDVSEDHRAFLFRVKPSQMCLWTVWPCRWRHYKLLERWLHLPGFTRRPMKHLSQWILWSPCWGSNRLPVKYKS